jgi:HlyD family secretion protein
VSAIYVKWGDQVKLGDPLFKIDTRDLQAGLQPSVSKIKEAEANLGKAKNRLRVAEGLSPGVSISAEELANRRFDVAIHEAALASAEAEVDQIRRQIEIRTIHAPLAGRILQLNMRLGEFAPSGALNPPLMLFGDDTELHLRVDIDESEALRFQPCARASASVRGSPDPKVPVRYARTDPVVVPKTLLTGDITQRTDTRVLQVIYSFGRASLPVYIGQQMDVFIETPAVAGTTPQAKPQSGTCADEAHGNGDDRALPPGKR